MIFRSSLTCNLFVVDGICPVLQFIAAGALHCALTRPKSKRDQGYCEHCALPLVILQGRGLWVHAEECGRGFLTFTETKENLMSVAVGLLERFD